MTVTSHAFEAATAQDPDGTYAAKLVVTNFATEADAKKMCRLFIEFMHGLAEVSEWEEYEVTDDDSQVH